MSSILNQLCSLVTGGHRSSVLFLGRDMPELRSRMSCFPSVDLNAANTKADLDEYILAATKELYPGGLFAESAAEVSTFLSANAQGVFLWAHLMISRLQAAITPCEISQILQKLPIGLEAMFEDSLQNLSKQTLNRQGVARKTFVWALCSYRPLTWAELQCALALDIHAEAFKENKKPFLSTTLELCSPILQYQGETSFLRPVHASVYDYFFNTGSYRTVGVQNFFLDKGASHRQLTLECLTTLSIAWRSEDAGGESPVLPLVKYTCLYWPDHLLSSSCDAEVMERLVTFLSSKYRTRWILQFLFWQPGTFVLQKLFLTQKRVLKWMPGDTPSELPDYLDWAFDIPTILLKGLGNRGQRVETDMGQTDIRMSSFNVSYFERLMVVRDLSRYFTKTGVLERAVQIFEDALSEDHKTTDETDHERLWILNTLGILYDQRGLTELSAQSQELALSLQTAALGPNHIETSWTKNEIGRVYRHQGRYKEAESMHLDALSILTSASADPERDLEIAWTLSTLGRVYRKRGQFDLAITKLTKAYHIRTETLGDHHPHCLWILGDIGQCHYERGHLDLAIDYHRRALTGREKVLGPDYSDTCWTMNNLGAALDAKGPGSRNEARALQEKALRGQEALFGVQHPHTLWTKEILDRWK
jgi:tetratricopeptide (TPR) repeat protein